jgi:hypothetical protein
VVIGMLDPNPQIRGLGVQRLRAANIQIDNFGPGLASEVEELNREFIRFHIHVSPSKKPVDESFVLANRNRSLDDWYRSINVIYWNRNFYRDPMAIFTHLVEVVGGLSLLASQKQKPSINPEDFVYKSVAWWMALCGKTGVKSIADMLWAKFPYVCAYCQHNPHDPDICSERKAQRPGPDWEALERLGKSTLQPRSLGEWQRMFSSVYPQGSP